MGWRLSPLIAVALLAGCGPLVQIGSGEAPPDALFTLRSVAPVAPQVAPRPGLTVLVDTPAIPGALQTTRVPVTTRDTQVAYMTSARWIEPPAELFQSLLADMIASRSGVIVVDPDNYDVDASQKLSGQLRAFGLDVRNPGQPVVAIRYDAVLSGARGGLTASRRFETTEPVASQQPATVAAALNTAANRLSIEVADWVNSSISRAVPTN